MKRWFLVNLFKFSFLGDGISHAYVEAYSPRDAIHKAQSELSSICGGLLSNKHNLAAAPAVYLLKNAEIGEDSNGCFLNWKGQQKVA